MQEIQFDNLIVEKSIVKQGGSVEFKEGSSIVVEKGENEAKIVVDDGENRDELTIPQKTGTLAIDEDVPFEKGSVEFSARQRQETGKENTASQPGSFAGGESSQALGKNSFAFGDHATSIGDGAFAFGKNTYAGIYGWYYKYLDLTTGTFYLTSEQPDVRKISDMGPEPEVDSSFESGFAVGDVISYVNKGKHDMCATVVEVTGNKIVVGTLNDKVQEILEEHPNHDDWTIFVPEKPEVGEIWLGECAFAEGSDSKAINAYSHAEGGRGCLAYGQYSHAEGKNTKAAYASHSEGSKTEANGQYSHAEGDTTKSNGLYSHAEGLITEANFKCSHAEGNLSKSESNYAHAEGYDTRAGDGTTEGGWCSHAEGNGAQATG